MINGNPQYEDLIDSYFDNTMSGDERESFMNELESNDQLKREFAFQTELQEAIADPGYEKVIETIEKVVRPNQTKDKPVGYKPIVRRLLRYAAIVLPILVIAIGLTYFLPSQSSDSSLFSSYFEPYPAYNTFRGETDTKALIESAFQNYESKNFDAATSDFSQLTLTYPSNMAYKFYQGNALLAQQDFEQAQIIFSQVAESEDELFAVQAKWYLGLCYLGKGQKEEARKIFEALREDAGSGYGNKAAKVLQELE